MLSRAKEYLTRPGKDNEEFRQYDGTFEAFGEFQDICRYCYNFNSNCKCIASVGHCSVSSPSNCQPENDYQDVYTPEPAVQNPREREVESSPFTQSAAGAQQYAPSPLVLFYSSPTSLEPARRSVDSEEYYLKARHRYHIPPQESRTVMTNLHVLRKEGELPRKLEVQDKIMSGWLSDSYSDMLVLKTGVLSPQVSGDVCVKIHNKTRIEVIVEAGSPIGVFKSTKYEYE